jgi:hypothetical protein
MAVGSTLECGLAINICALAAVSLPRYVQRGAKTFSQNSGKYTYLAIDAAQYARAINVVTHKNPSSKFSNFCSCESFGHSRWLRGLRRGSTAARLLGLRIRIPPAAWMSVSCECCVLSDRGQCVGLIPRAEESYRVSVCH